MKQEELLGDYSHKRQNILTGQWVLVSPHRAKRPWQGQEEKAEITKGPSYDENCFLCPGNSRITGEQNPIYEHVYVFQNDFAALSKKVDEKLEMNSKLFKASLESGICRVVCFSPDHSKTLSDLSCDEINYVIEAWKDQYEDLSGKDDIRYIQIFENKGAVMGCSNPHPHGQIWAQSSVPNEVKLKDQNQKTYFKKEGQSLLGDYLKEELRENKRIVYENDSWVVLVPFWAVWPFETMIVPKERRADLSKLSVEEKLSFAQAISKISRIYDRVFDTSFPYSSGIHQAPVDPSTKAYWHMHMSFYPPLLRSASVKKFMVGYEMFGMPQRDISPEQVAQLLKDLGEKII